MEDLKEEIKDMEDGASKELLKAAYKASMKKNKDKSKTEVKSKNAKMRKQFKEPSKKNKGWKELFFKTESFPWRMGGNKKKR